MKTKELIRQIIQAKNNGIRIDLAIRIICEKYDIKPEQFDLLASELNKVLTKG